MTSRCFPIASPSGEVGAFRRPFCSEDLDFTLIEETPWEEIERGLAAAFEEARTRSGVEIRLDHLDRHAHENSHAFYLAYEGPLPGAAGKTVKTDITIRERVVLPVEERRLLRGYAEYRDLPEGARLLVYSLDEVAVEKTVALLDRARNEPRDLYDLWFLTANGHVTLPDLVDPIVQKLGFGGLTLAQVGAEFRAKEARLRRLWDVRLAPQMAELPEFEEVYRAVRRSLRAGGCFREMMRSQPSVAVGAGVTSGATSHQESVGVAVFDSGQIVGKRLQVRELTGIETVSPAA